MNTIILIFNCFNYTRLLLNNEYHESVWLWTIRRKKNWKIIKFQHYGSDADKDNDKDNKSDGYIDNDDESYVYVYKNNNGNCYIDENNESYGYIDKDDNSNCFIDKDGYIDKDKDGYTERDKDTLKKMK